MMKLLIFGATRGTGCQLVMQALAAGHQVTAIVRRPEAITIDHPALTVRRGDVLDPETLGGVAIGHDAVLSSIGMANADPTVLYSEGMRNIIAMMVEARVQRLMCVTASGLDPGPLLQRLIAKPILWRLFKHGFTDMMLMEEIVKQSGLTWTIMRPPRLTDGKRTGRTTTAIDTHLTRGFMISRADLADYMLQHIDDPATFCATVEIAH
jgi:putative NADH-flavin reductase